MRGGSGVALAGLAIYLAAAAQQGISSQWLLFGGHFDFLLLVVGSLCLYTNRTGGALLGFVAGATYGALSGANIWQYIVTRTLTAFLVSWLAEGGIDRNVFTAFVASVATVLLAQIGLMFLAPPGEVGAFLGDTIRTAVYNGILAMLLYAAFNRIFGPRR